jgi:hypothetical protein
MSKNQNLTTTQEDKQSNMKDHSESEFQSIVERGLLEGGIHLNAGKGHGKTRLLFSMAQSIRNLDTCRVLIFDGSEAWLYGFSKIPVFTIGEHDIQLISDIATTEDIERYQLTNWNLVKLALETHKDILFRLKTRKPSKRGFFIRTVINHLDALQRTERETTPNHEPKQKIVYFIEEAQDAFNIRSTMKIEAEEFLTVFNEARNNFEGFYTCCQRETDFSKTIRTKQLMAYGKIPECDKSAYMRRLEKQYSVDFSKLPQRTWFFEGSTFVSPEWKQQGKPYQINSELKQQWLNNLPKPQKLTLKQRFNNWLAEIRAVQQQAQQRKLSRDSQTVKEPEHDVTYGEDSFEQEDDEFHEEVW